MKKVKQEGIVLRALRQILVQERYALITVILLMLIPYSAWASMTVLSLVTLRRGWRQGIVLLIPAFTTHTLVSLSTVVWSVACIDALIRILPCFIAACILRATNSWKSVAVLLFGFAIIGAMALQIWMPQLIDAQFVYLQTVIRNMNSGQSLLDVWEARNIPSFVIANFLFGFQEMCLLTAIISPLLFARSLQAQLFYPGGFRQEMLNFRGDKYGVLVLLILIVASAQNHVLAMNALPLLLLIYSLTGLSLCSHVFSKMKPFKMAILLLLPFILLPVVALPFYILIGVIDSCFNFRLYLSSRAGKIL